MHPMKVERFNMNDIKFTFAVTRKIEQKRLQKMMQTVNSMKYVPYTSTCAF